MVENPSSFPELILQTVGALWLTVELLTRVLLQSILRKLVALLLHGRYIPEVNCFNGRTKVIG